MKIKPPLRQRTSAFTLVEVVLALGIFAFAMVAMFVLFSVGINTNRESSEQIQAANFASLLVSTRRALPTNSIAGFALPPLNAPYSSSDTAVRNVAIDGTLGGAPAYNVLYRLGTNATMPQVAQVHLLISWPPGPSVAPPSVNNRYEVTTQIAVP